MKVKCDVCGNEMDISEQEAVAQVPLAAAQQPEEQNTPENMLSELLLNSQEQCTMIDGMIRNQIDRKDALIDELHSELQSYKDDRAGRFVDQVMKSLIKIRNDMVRCTEAPQWANMTLADVQREYGYVLDDLTDLLQQQSIDPYRTAPRESFRPAIHQVAKQVPTSDPALDKTVQQSVCEGYTKGDKTFLAERVAIYRYKPQQVDEAGQ